MLRTFEGRYENGSLVLANEYREKIPNNVSVLIVVFDEASDSQKLGIQEPASRDLIPRRVNHTEEIKSIKPAMPQNDNYFDGKFSIPISQMLNQLEMELVNS